MQGTVTPDRNKRRMPSELPWWLVVLVIIAMILVVAVLSLSLSYLLGSSDPKPTEIPAIVIPTRIDEQATTAATTPPITPGPSESGTLPATATGVVATVTLPPSPESTRSGLPTTQPLVTATTIFWPTATMTWPTATAVPVFTSWRGEYFSNPNLAGTPSLYRDDLAIAFEWGGGSPAPGLPVDAFSARWQRTLPFAAGTYRFFAQSDDGVRIWLDDQLLIDQWHDAGSGPYSADRSLISGNHSLRIDYYENWGPASIHFWWEPVSQFPNWRADYFSNTNLSGAPLLTRNDLAINFNWGWGNPAPGIPADNFSIRWSRTEQFDTGIYRFHAIVDDGVRIFIDDKLVLNDWRNGSLREITADYSISSGLHRVRAEYFENRGDARINVWWERVASPSYPDWKAEYWANRQFIGSPALIRNDAKIDFNWGRGAPASGLPTDDFSVRWSRSMRFDEGHYRFHAVMDDGLRLYLDGILLIDEWRDGRAHVLTRDINLNTGLHSLRVDYYENSGEAMARVWWEKIGGVSYPDWKGEYYANRQLEGAPSLTRNDAQIDFNWKQSAPAQGLPADNFSARWSRQVNLKAGVHRFSVRADDGVRVYLDDKLIINEWHDSSGSKVYQKDMTLAAGKYKIVVEYYERSKDAQIKFWRERIGDIPVPSATPTMTASPTSSPTPSPTSSPTPSPTASPTETATPTETPTETPSPTATAAPDETPSPTATATKAPIPVPEPVRINEVLTVPGTFDWNGDQVINASDAWIELVNVGEKKVDLSGWHLVVNKGQDGNYKIPKKTLLKPDQFLHLFASETGLNLASGDELSLIDKQGVPVSRVVLPELAVDASYSADEAGQWHADWPPSPRLPNIPLPLGGPAKIKGLGKPDK